MLSQAVGGSKGHEIEIISGSILDLYLAFSWKMLPKCTGRYTCLDHAQVSHLTPPELAESIGIPRRLANGCIIECFEFNLPGKDPVLVYPLDEHNTTGIITYVKVDANAAPSTIRYVHTLNTPSGFRRKLEAIGISVSDASIKLSTP